MCLLRTNATADAGFAAIARAEKVSKYERTLADLANADSVAVAAGLHLRLQSLVSWEHDPELRRVRKIRMGGRRVYVQGHHSECAYLICYVVVDKRSEEDRAEDPRLKARIFRALVEPPTRTLVGPAPEAALPSVTLPRELVERAFGQGDSAARQHLVQAAWQAVVTTYQASGRPVPEAATLTREVGLLVSQAETEYWIQRGQR